jgi:hypothetical protein
MGWPQAISNHLRGWRTATPWARGGCPTNNQPFPFFKNNNNMFSNIFILFIHSDTCRNFIGVNVAPNGIYKKNKNKNKTKFDSNEQFVNYASFYWH